MTWCSRGLTRPGWLPRRTLSLRLFLIRRRWTSCPTCWERGCKVVDLSADYRFKDAAVYESWYQVHKTPGLLAEAVYGLPEIHRDEIRTARLVGNPGCYATSIILAAAPVLKSKLVVPASLIADSKSGVSGAGAVVHPWGFIFVK